MYLRKRGHGRVVLTALECFRSCDGCRKGPKDHFFPCPVFISQKFQRLASELEDKAGSAHDVGQRLADKVGEAITPCKMQAKSTRSMVDDQW